MRLLAILIDVYSLVVLVTVIASWVPSMQRTPLAAAAEALTEPALEPIRRILPPAAGLDFSPMVLLILLRVLGSAI